MIDAFLKETMLEHLVTYAIALCLGLVLLPSQSGVNVLRDRVIDYEQMICSSTLLMNVNRVKAQLWRILTSSTHRVRIKVWILSADIGR